MKKLEKITIRRGDRQSPSILSHQKFTHEKDAVTAAEMLKYVQLSSLARTETKGSTSYATNTGKDLGARPATHVQPQLPSKED
jgi:hypothetical protein